jgi:hypothetical protein
VALIERKGVKSIDLDKFFFAQAAIRANPIIRQVFKRRAGSNPAEGIAFFGVIDIAT